MPATIPAGSRVRPPEPVRAPETSTAPARVRMAAIQVPAEVAARPTSAVPATMITGAVYWSEIATPTGTRLIAS